MRRVCLFTVLFLLLISSCSKAEDSQSYEGNETLKNVLKTKGESAVWSRELESELLKERLSVHHNISDKIKLSPEILVVSNVPETELTGNTAEKIYPHLLDFGSLDTENLSKTAGDVVSDFCQALIQNIYSAETIMDSGSIFSFVFFVNDLEKQFFQSEISVSEDGSTSNPAFTDFLIGTSFLSGEEVQVPVRLFSENKICDISLFVNEKNKKIKQIKIDSIKK